MEVPNGFWNYIGMNFVVDYIFVNENEEPNVALDSDVGILFILV